MVAMENQEEDAKSLRQRRKEFKQLTEGLVTHILMTKRTDYYACAAEYFDGLLKMRERAKNENTDQGENSEEKS